MAVGLPMKTTYANGDVYSASDVNDITGTVNLVGQTNNFYAGKNKIINGNYYFNQRNFTSTTTTGTYMFDRWITAIGGDGTSTYTAQTFAPGTAPVSGYESKSYQRIVTTGQTNASVATITYQPIEDVRTFAGQTVTYSFWAKASSGTPKIALSYDQNFGTGGSADVTAYISQVTLSTSWARYSVSFTVPSISGKTIGSTPGWLGILLWVSAGSSSNTITNSLGIQTNTFDLWGHQLEAGSTATAFQTASGTIQGELALCQRYYFRWTANGVANSPLRHGYAYSSTAVQFIFNPPVTMRATISSTIQYASLWCQDISTGTTYTPTAIGYAGSTPNTIFILLTGMAGLTTYREYTITDNGSTGGYLGLDAEL